MLPSLFSSIEQFFIINLLLSKGKGYIVFSARSDLFFIFSLFFYRKKLGLGTIAIFYFIRLLPFLQLRPRPPSGDTKAETPVSSTQDIEIPIKKEEIGEVSKTPYVKEEAVVKKKRVTETK